jgi:hypothetical protein
VTGVVGAGPHGVAVAVDELLQVGDVVAFPLPGGGFGAAQVTSTDGRSAVVCALDGRWPDPSEPARLAGVGPLHLTHHAWNEVECAHVDLPPSPRGGRRGGGRQRCGGYARRRAGP